MAHLIEQCDFLDVLEESAVLKTPVSIELRGGGRFVDRVRDVVTEDGQDFALFVDHGRIALRSLSSATRAAPLLPSYDGKRGQ